MTPINIETALHTMSLLNPENQWYIDTNASSHTIVSQGDPMSHTGQNEFNSVVKQKRHSSRIPMTLEHFNQTNE